MELNQVWRPAFLEALSKCGNITEACKAVGVSRVTVYDHKKRDAAFAEQWENALQTAGELLERECWRRAHDGIEEPVFYKGEVCGTIRRYSDLLIIFLLKGIFPHKYRENVKLAPDELKKLIEQELRAARGEEDDGETIAAVN
ncbi:MAG TPA: hypothetical protein VJ180_08540 [Pyrinomonadaceae bacterium]|nr:hypothetical protein [Pyrinomonadaceae bacterium]